MNTSPSRANVFHVDRRSLSLAVDHSLGGIARMMGGQEVKRRRFFGGEGAGGGREGVNGNGNGSLDPLFLAEDGEKSEENRDTEAKREMTDKEYYHNLFKSLAASPPPAPTTTPAPWSRRYLGEMIAMGFATAKGTSYIKPGDRIYLDRTAKKDPPKKGATLGVAGGGQKTLKTSFFANARTPSSSNRSKENAIVRFTNARGFEVGRIRIEFAMFLGRLMDIQGCEFEGQVVDCPTSLQVGSDIIISLSVYIKRSLFLTPVDMSAKEDQHSVFKEADETAQEKKIKDQKEAISSLLDAVGLRPVRANPLLTQNKAKGLDPNSMKDVYENHEQSTAMARSPSQRSEGGGEEELNQDEINLVYSKAQENDFDLPEARPPESFALTLRPYQAQALGWMMTKEQEGLDETREDDAFRSLHPLYEEYLFPPHESQMSANDEHFYFNPYSGQITLDFPRASEKCKGGILADEMGLGKTIMMASLIHSMRPNRPTEEQTSAASFGSLRKATKSKGVPHATLVVAPMSLIAQWRDELERSSRPDSMAVLMYYGTDRTDLNQVVDGFDVIVTSYGTVLSEYNRHLAELVNHPNKQGQGLFGLEFFRIILDEAHHIKSRITATSKACFALKGQARWCITGTPIVNRLEDLFSLLKFIGLEPWGNYSFYRQFITIPFEKKDPGAINAVQVILKSILLRREKSMKDRNGNAIVSLPPKVVNVEYLDFAESEREIYKSVFTMAKSRFDKAAANGTLLKQYVMIFSILMRLRQACLHPLLVLKKSGKTVGEAEESDKAAQDLMEGDENLNKLISKYTNVEDLQGENPFQASVLQKLLNGGQSDVDLGDDLPDECPLCLDPIEFGVLLPCLHSGCKQCIVDYLQSQELQEQGSTCPVCRQGPVREDQLLEIVKRPDNGPAGAEGKDNVLSRAKISLRRNDFKSSTKLTALLRHLLTVRDGRTNDDRGTPDPDPSNRCVVFSQFTSFLDLIQVMLSRDDIQFVRLDGSMSQVEREKVLKSFNEPSSTLVILLISLRAGGVGLNLTAANRVFMMDCWWNAAVENQAIDRVHRLGQNRPVTVTRFIIRESVEERMLALQARKTALVMSTMGEAKEQRLDDLKAIFEDF